MGGVALIQAQWQKTWFEQMEREGKKVIVVDPKSELKSQISGLQPVKKG
ncbi:hypothetical protein GCM10007416_05080 [Kroppenstedtia guangzhouensis]|uniref:Uncharacterized protein n=1 Tax=Kroppenstedtia guangzhouensis TaxID=1274356 RepID=A0ABQ1G0W8_9BACL|nr:hypothetical protein GCM10007416_05080 [Kroppenstedtia guangzhouensis]